MKEGISVAKLRALYVRFFETHGHKAHASGSLIPYDVTGKLDDSLLFNGAGMIQFKPYFRGTAQPTHPRLVTVQKCLRTGDIDEVGDDSHLTFFEMLGNFSFGDYFKEIAVSLSWEFLTSKEWLGLDPSRLAFTVFEEDSVAENEWIRHLKGAGIDPNQRVFRLGEETNYWPAGSFSSGPPGPCGPNSEMFFWVPSSEPPPASDYSREDFERDEKSGKWLEIWNDVFISFEWQGELNDPAKPGLGYKKSGMPDLPFKSIDTGMGLERTAAVLSGFSTVYETDAFTYILDAIRRLTPSDLTATSAQRTKAERIIADHARAMTMAIADGILPGNNGRGYVLRRIIRRAVLQGFRTLKLPEGFLGKIGFEVLAHPDGAHSEVKIDRLGDAYPAAQEKAASIAEILHNEEKLFRRTLQHGMDRLESMLVGKPDTISGEEAFKLYDTFGFPLEITLELAAEAGWGVDIDGYEEAMKDAQNRSRSSQDRDSVYGKVGSESDLPATVFLGYSKSESHAEVLEVIATESGEVIVLDQTPFYAASGGQIGDTGQLALQESSKENKVIAVQDTRKSSGHFHHVIEGQSGLVAGSHVEATIDRPRRHQIQRNHTATHLLHAALHQVVGKHAQQAGSYVGPDRLRFDFTHGAAVSPQDLAEIEQIVQAHVLKNDDVITHVDLQIEEARKRGAMALFGEKYGNKVRMVEIGEFSRELCGGTHVRTTGEIGLFHIVSEGSASSGVRRIEAITGEAAAAWALEMKSELQKAASLLKVSEKDILGGIERLQTAQKDLKRQLESARSHSSQESVTTEVIAGVSVSIDGSEHGSMEEIKEAVDRIVANNPSAVGISTAVSEGKVLFAVKVGADAQSKGIKAGDIVKVMAQATGGGGGGGPAFATAGGKQPEKRAEANEAALAHIRSVLG